MSIARTSVALLVLAVIALLPFMVLAQAGDDLKAVIRAELLSDPRTSSLTDVQIDAMVDILSGEAQKQGITKDDIMWRPQTFSDTSDTGASADDLCGSIPTFLCTFSESFGFIGYDVTIPFSLGLVSMGLIWILAEMIHRHKHPVIPVPPPAPTAGTL